MTPKLVEASPAKSIRCTMCGKSDVVPTRQRKWWDGLFRLASRSPWICRACGWRFYVKQRR